MNTTGTPGAVPLRSPGPNATVLVASPTLKYWKLTLVLVSPFDPIESRHSTCGGTSNDPTEEAQASSACRLLEYAHSDHSSSFRHFGHHHKLSAFSSIITSYGSSRSLGIYHQLCISSHRDRASTRLIPSVYTGRGRRCSLLCIA